MVSWFRRGRQQSEDPGPPVTGVSSADEDSPEQLTALVTELVWYINANAGRLPTEAVVNSRYICDLLTATIATAEVRELDVYAAISVRSVASDYLRTTLATYLAASSGPSARAGDDAATAQLLNEQVRILWDSAARVLDAASARDVDALRSQGNFLRTKFSRSDLDL